MAINRNADYGGEEGAKTLAQHIEKYWWARGFLQVRAWAAFTPAAEKSGGYWGVKSNLVDGKAPEAVPARKAA